ncbi:unnamed protein product [Hymenolepis diminuta]|uniref:BACK domain-containing protein n=1 Tax=Hymenolepis diminuta TaxID=6216 RepID=A0A0R3SX25_HYMDI|nr:unnamed protein product [Hymenolepis diminuta]
MLKIASDFDSFVGDQKCLCYTGVKSMEALLSSAWLWTPSEESRLKAVALWINAATFSDEREIRNEFFTHLLSTFNVNKHSRSIIAETAMRESDIVLSGRVNPCNSEVNIVKSMDRQGSGASAVVYEHEILVFGGFSTTKDDEVLSTCGKYFLS